MTRRLARGVLISLCALGASAAPALAAHDQSVMFEDPGVVSNPAPTLQTLRLLGVDEVRVFMLWQYLAPGASSKSRPRTFRHAADPASYPDAAWASWDGAIKQAQADGITVNLDVAGGAPRWALGPGLPTDQPHPSWAPDPVQYGAFVRAVATRYGGSYNPITHRIDQGNPADLPAVRFWSVWNEPNYGPSLSPQGVPGHLKIERSPLLYRRLLDAAWTSLMQTGHRRDTILFGEIAPRGFPAKENPHASWGVFSGMKPLTFLRALYCVGSDWRPLRSSAATLRGCPSTSAGARAFRSAHPALFSASGFADHPYSRWYPPNVEATPDPEYSTLADIGQLEAGLDRLQRVYGSHRRFPIWNTEYGYITSPPKHPTRRLPYVSAPVAASYINQAEYMSWRDSRIASFAQYLLGDPLAPTEANTYGGFASGLVSHDGHLKVTYSAFRLPLYLPQTSFRRGGRLEVWGCARPAFFALTQVPGETQSVDVQFARAHKASFSTVRTVDVTDAHGYFDLRIAFPGSGTVRLVYRYPADDPSFPANYPVYSRHVAIRAR